jgi:hypothetical protein
MLSTEYFLDGTNDEVFEAGDSIAEYFLSDFGSDTMEEDGIF